MLNGVSTSGRVRGTRKRRFRVAGILLLLVSATTTCPVRAALIRVEKDGSGDFTVIQDALDAAASGDSVLIGKGRFEDFHIEEFQSGGTGAMIMVPRLGPLTIVGAGRDSTIVGPLTQVPYHGGYITGGFANDLNPPSIHVEDIWFHNTSWPIQLQGEGPIEFQRCRFSGGDRGQVALVSASSVTFGASEFLGAVPDGGIRAIESFLGGDNDSLKVRNCRFRWGGGISLIGSGGFEARDLVFEDVGVPIRLSFVTGSIRNVVAYSPGNRALDISDSSVELADCYFGEGPRTTLYLVSDSTLDAVRCNFGGGTDYTLYLASAATVSVRESNILHLAPMTAYTITEPGLNLTWNFEGSYWGSSDSTEIASWILDGRDSAPPGTERPIIDFVPFVTERIPIANTKTSISSLKSRYQAATPKD